MDFAINIDPDAPLPLHRQVYEELRRAILLGRLTSGGNYHLRDRLLNYLVFLVLL